MRLGTLRSRFSILVPELARMGDASLAVTEGGDAEDLGLASWVRSVPADHPIIRVIDVPSRSYSYVEELFGLHQALAASVKTLAERHLSGTPVITVVVGATISGTFLATGFQSHRIVTLDHDGIQVQVMSKASTDRITRRTIAELDEAAKAVPAPETVARLQRPRA